MGMDAKVNNWVTMSYVDYASPDCNMGEVIFNGQVALNCLKAKSSENSKDGWIEVYALNFAKKDDKEFLPTTYDIYKDKGGNYICIKLAGDITIFKLDKKGNKIKK